MSVLSAKIVGNPFTINLFLAALGFIYSLFYEIPSAPTIISNVVCITVGGVKLKRNGKLSKERTNRTFFISLKNELLEQIKLVGAESAPRLKMGACSRLVPSQGHVKHTRHKCLLWKFQLNC